VVESYAANKELLVLLVSEGNELLGIAPLWRYVDVSRRIPIKRISFITSPDTPFVDFIAQPDKREQILQTIIKYLHTEERSGWDLLTLNRWQACSPNYEVFTGILQLQRRYFFSGFPSRTPYVSIQGTWKDFLQTRSGRFKKTYRNISNKLNRLREVRVQFFGRDEAGTVLKDVFSVSDKSWKGKEGIAICSQQETKNFFQVLTNLASKEGWLLIGLLKTQDVPIAMEYDLLYEGRVYALRADYDESFSEYSPGAYLEYEILKASFDGGLIEYSTGPGLNAYKLKWTDQLQTNVTLHICNGNPRSLLIWALEGVLAAVRKIESEPKSSILKREARFKG
jgi:hypothetical protein